MERKAIQLLVEGKVQGVGYRAWTKRTARSLGLFGWVRNITDGRVEIHAEGQSEALDKLASACEEGPSFAEVRRVIRRERPDCSLIQFEQIATVSIP